jgi:predicted lipid carrier protein YhbT
MFPYIQRVLQQAKNWMIHSTGLLERSWLEYEKRRTFDRALLQIQALLDQHTTKLTIMQSTFKAIEESAPVQDRLQYIYGIVYPAQYELKRDLAIRYLK